MPRLIVILLTALTALPAAAQDFPAGAFRLQTALAAPDLLCLDGALDDGASLRMRPCAERPSQIWTALPARGRAWRLTTAEAEPLGLCLDGALGGALGDGTPATMLPCADLPGQDWEAIGFGDGTFQLAVTGLLAEAGAVLAALPPGAEPIVEIGKAPGIGAVIATGGLDARSRVPARARRCLEGNLPSPAARLGGASFLDRCHDVTGQTWRVGLP